MLGRRDTSAWTIGTSHLDLIGLLLLGCDFFLFWVVSSSLGTLTSSGFPSSPSSSAIGGTASSPCRGTLGGWGASVFASGLLSAIEGDEETRQKRTLHLVTLHCLFTSAKLAQTQKLSSIPITLIWWVSLLWILVRDLSWLRGDKMAPWTEVISRY